jgi:Tfp pilus assembly protein PilZ
LSKHPEVQTSEKKLHAKGLLFNLGRNKLLTEMKDMFTEKEERLSKFNGKNQIVERRTNKRKNQIILIEYIYRNRLHRDFIQNISVGGVFIETKQPFSPRKEILMTIPFFTTLKCLKIKGEIIRVCRQGIAVKFKKKSGKNE